MSWMGVGRATGSGRLRVRLCAAARAATPSFVALATSKLESAGYAPPMRKAGETLQLAKAQGSVSVQSPEGAAMRS